MLTSPPEMKFVMSLSALHTKVLKRVDGQLSIHGISFTEYMVLYHLSGAPNKTMRRIELAESIGISASGVTRLLAPMEKIHLVEKEANPRDARVSLVKLSKKGTRLFRDATVGVEQAAESLMEPLNAKQLDKLLELTERLL